MSNIRFLGIYEEEIDKAVNLSELAMKREGFTEKEIEEMRYGFGTVRRMWRLE